MPDSEWRKTWVPSPKWTASGVVLISNWLGEHVISEPKWHAALTVAATMLVAYVMPGKSDG